MTRPKPACVELLDWLRENLGRQALAPLTGTDSRALQAVAHLLRLYTCGVPSAHEGGVLVAFRELVRCMQEKTRWLAYHAIARELDWGSRSVVWRAAGLSENDLPADGVPRCRFEP